MSASILQNNGTTSPELKFAQSYTPKLDPEYAEASSSSKHFTPRIRTTSRDTYNEEKSEIGRPCWECECPSGFIPHTFRKNCSSCKCPKDSHDLLHDEWLEIQRALGLNSKDANATDLFQRPLPRPHVQGYQWAPPNLTPDQIAEFYKDFPADQVPKIGTPGEVFRDRQILHQIPKQDLALAYCKHVDKEHSAYEDFIALRNETALDVALAGPVTVPDSKCEGCRTHLDIGQIAVHAAKFGEDAVWHPKCFKCSTCQQPLVDLTYCKYKEGLFCERHYAEQIYPRCMNDFILLN